MKNLKLLFATLLVVSLGAHITFSQGRPEYFDFWEEGKWVSDITIFNGDTIPEKDSFFVRKMSDKNAFLEEWSIFIGEGEYVKATVIRAFDNETKKWKLFYVDDINAQTWDSEYIDNKVNFIKEFNFKGKKFYSRQTWFIGDDNELIRTIERSEDNTNWVQRYWQIFKKSEG